jgi:hypothetical protein
MTIHSASPFPLQIRESMSTRFSGLIEYSATFLIDKGGSVNFNINADIATSLGPVTIFPGIKYVRNNESPFDEAELTAYGQGSPFGTRIVFGSEVLELSKTFELTNSQNVTETWTVYETWLCQTATKHDVLQNSSSNYSEPSNSLDKSMMRRWVVGPGSVLSLNIIWNTGRRDIQRTNFGKWDEVAVMVGYIPEVS